MSGAQRAVLILVSTLCAGAVSADPPRQEQGDPRLDYVLQCQGCHLADASGAPDAGVPRMAGFVGRFTRVEGGRAYLVQVPGVSQAPLSNRALAELLNWMLVEFSADELPQPFEPYSEAEVARHRAGHPIDVPVVRARLIEAIEVPGGEK